MSVNPYEQEIVDRLNLLKGARNSPLFPKLKSSYGLRDFDHALKLDIITENTEEMKDFGLLIQAKRKGGVVKYPLVLSKLEAAKKVYPDSIPIVYHKQVIQGKECEEYTILYTKDFENLIRRYETIIGNNRS